MQPSGAPEPPPAEPAPQGPGAPSSRRIRLLLVAGLVLANLLVWGYSAWSLQQSRQRDEAAARTLTRNITQALDQSVARTATRVDLALLAVVDELERQLAGKGLDDQAVNALLDLQVQRVPEIEAIRVTRADGQLILGQGLAGRPASTWADRPFYAALRQQRDASLHIAQPVLGRVSKQPLVPFLRRYHRPDGSFAGLVGAAVLVEHFTRLLQPYDVGTNGTLILRDAGLGLVTRVPALPENPAGKLGNQVVSEDFRRLFDSGAPTATGFTAASPDGFQRIFTFHRMTQAPMVTIAAVSTQDYLQGWYDELRRSLAIAGAFGLLSLFFGAALIRLLNRADADLGALREQRRFVTSILDSLAEQVAVIDARGVITAVNAAWRRFAAENAAPRRTAQGVGTDYLQVCASAEAGAACAEAQPALAGIRAVLDGSRAEFSLEYPCHSPQRQRWFMLHVRPLVGQQRGAVLIHQDLSFRHEAEALLRASEARYRLLAEHISDVIWVLDLGGWCFSYISPSVRQLCGHAPEDLLAQPLQAALTPASAQALGNRIRARLQAGAAGGWDQVAEVTEVDQLHRDGHIVHTEVALRFLVGDDGQPSAVLGVSRDIGQRKDQQARLLASEEHFRLLAENMEDVVWKTDQDLVFTYINDADRRLRGFPRDEVLGHSIEGTLTAQGRQVLARERQQRAALEALGERGRARYFEVPQRRVDGGEVWVEVMSIPVYDATGRITGYQGIGRDISRRKTLQAELERSRQALEVQLQAIASQQTELREQVNRDPLTCAHNRRYLDEALPLELARARAGGYPVAVIMIDLDHFKQVNDNHSHLGGDAVLKALTALLSASARDGDIVCRYGGEEFVLVIPRLGPEAARLRVDGLRQRLEQLRIPYGADAIAVTFSAGIAVFPDHGDRMETLLGLADEMLYLAKREGRNRVRLCSGG